MKDKIMRFIGSRLQGLVSSPVQLKLAAVLCAGLFCTSLAHAQVNDLFGNASGISGITGTTNGSNAGATLESCETNAVNCDDDGLQPVGTSIWYVWTAPTNGTVEFDTIGSDFDTVLSVWQTTNGLCDVNLTNIISDDNTGFNTFGDVNNTSYASFNAVAGQTYYISVDGNNGDFGNSVLSWSFTSIASFGSGTFKFTAASYAASELDSAAPNGADGNTVSGWSVNGQLGARLTVTRTGGSSGRAMVDYAVTGKTYQNTFITNYYGTNIFSQFFTTNGVFTTNTTFTITVVSNIFQITAGGQTAVLTNAFTNILTVISNNILSPPGIFVATITGGGPFSPVPTNVPPPNFTVNIITNGYSTNFVTDGLTFTNITITNFFELPTAIFTTNVLATGGVSLASGTLIFDDYQMSQDIIIPVFQAPGPDMPFLYGVQATVNVSLSNARLDPLESSDLNPPTVDPAVGTTVLTVQNPVGPMLGRLDPNNPPQGFIDFERSTFQVDKDVNGGNAVVSVYCYGDSGDTVTVGYRIDFGPGANQLHTFTVEAGSDYATPDNQVNPDFTSVTGTLTFAPGNRGAGNPQTITIPILNNGAVEFNEDMQLQLFNAAPAANVSIGNIGTANLTDLFDDRTAGQQPAGAVDRTWNQNGVNSSIPPFLQFPGTAGGASDSANGNGGTVYAIAEQPNGEAIIAGSFNSFDSQIYHGICRVLNNGFQDSSFLAQPLTGANSFIAALALQPDGRIIIAGNFTAFNGLSRAHIARLNSDGTVDTTFNPGLGAVIPGGGSAMIWSVFLQTNGQIVVGGDFTMFNTNNVNGVARLNADGSVDTSFNPGIGPDGTVSAVAVDSVGRVIIGGDFDSVGGVSSGGVARLNVDGSVDTTFNPGIGTYNPGTGSTDPVYAIAIEPGGQILIGGGFSYLDLDTANGLARLNTDGTVDTTFITGTGTYNPQTGFADKVYAITLQPADGKILIGGDFQNYNQTRRVGIARLNVNGDLDTTFMDTAYNQFAGLINHYHNNNAVNTNLYPEGNQRNYVYSIGLEAGGNVLVGGGFLRVGGGSTRDDTRPRSNVARLIGGATPGPGNIELSYPSYSVDKDAGQLYVSLVRTNGNLGIIAATFYTNTADPGPGIAIPDANFTLSPQYVEPTWGTSWPTPSWMYDVGVFGPNYSTTPLGTAGANVYLNIINNTQITGNLSANVGVTAPNGTDIFFLGGENIPLGAALGAQQISPLTIIDDNVRPGVLGFSSVAYTVVDNQTTATITVVRTNGSDGVVQVNYKTTNGSGTNGIDYGGVTNTLTFAGGVTSQTFTVPIKPSSTLKPDKTVKLNLSSTTGGATLGLTNATLTIVDHNYAPGQLSFSSAQYFTNENAGAAQITVTRLGGSSGTMDVSAITANGTAQDGVNYTATNYPLHWDNGDATAKMFYIPVKQDFVVTPNLTVKLRLTNSLVGNVPNSAPLTNNSTTNATLTIGNVDNAGSLQFSAPIYSVKKYGGFALIPVVRVGGSAQTVTVQYSTANGTATPANYVPTNNTLTFNNGEVSKFITVPIIDDGTFDGPLYLNLSLTLPTGGAILGTPNTAVLNIIDTAGVNEPPGSQDVTYNTSGFNNSVYAVALQSNNKLLVGGDFTLANGVPRQRVARLNADGSLDTQFSLPSSAYGANGSIRTIAVQADGRIVLGGFFTNFNSTAANRITRVNPDGTLDSLFNPGSGADNPVYALQETFVGGLSKMMVGGSFATLAGTPINGIARLNYDGTLDTSFSPGQGANGTVYALAVQPTDGKVVIGGDFTAVNGNTNCNHVARLNTDGSIDTTFTLNGGASDSVRAITIQPDGNILIGGLFTNVNGVAESHIARLNQNGTVDNTFTPGVGANDAVFSIVLQSDNRIVLGGEFTHCSGVTRNRITRLNPDGTVDPTINFGLGANNFVAAMVVMQDTIAGYPTNVPDEKIIIGGGFTQYDGATNNYLARIYGGSISGSGAFQFSSPNYSVDENGTNVLITVIRTGGTSGTNAAGTSDVQVPFATSDGTAFNNTNYIGISTNLVFPLGEVIQTISIPVIDDNVVTPNLTANLTISPLIPSQVGLQPTALLTIINDDSTINFTAGTYTVPKNVINGVAVIGVQRLGSVRGTSSVTFTTTGNGTATPGTDYTPVGPATVTFAPGVSNSIVTIPINNNGLPEGNRTVTMQITGATGSTLVSPSNAVLTIVDTVNAPGQLSFSATNYFVTEGGGSGYTNATISVVRTFGSAGVVSVNFSTLDGTALAGTKYVATNGTLSFGDGETVKSFVVQVRNTATAEGPEFLNLFLSNPGGGASLLAPTNSTLTILNTNVGVAFTSAINTFSEAGGVLFNGNPDTVFISVTRFNNTNVTTSVNYATADGTALSNINYTVTAGTLTFHPGDSVLTIPVQLIHNTNVTGTLTFTMSLSNPSANAQLTSPSTTLIQELDAETGISFLTPSMSVLKTAGFALLPVSSSNPNLGTVSVHYSTGGGSASPGTDYTPESGTLIFTNGQAFNFILIPILPNGLVQNNQTFNVTLSSPGAPGVLGTYPVETVTIIETNTPSGSSYFSPIVAGGDNGSSTFDTSNSLALTGSPIAWFAWTATNSGEMEFDTIGSVDDSAGITNLGTAMAVFTGTNFNSLNTLVENEGLYPLPEQLNNQGQNIYNLFSAAGIPVIFSIPGGASYIQPYAGPAQVRFNAVAGQTYYVAVETFQEVLSEAEVGLASGFENIDGINFPVGGGLITESLVESPPTGNVKLNWALHPSGVFRFATEEIDQTGMTYSNTMPMLMYHVSETEQTRRPTGVEPANQPQTTVDGSMFLTNSKYAYPFDMPGLLVSVTRVAGSSGRVQVGYTTVPITSGNLLGTNGYLVNGDLPASPTGSIVTNNGILTFAPADYTPVSGILTFDDSEMSKTIFIPISDDGGLPRPNRDFTIILTNAVLDPAESTDVQQPRLDNTFNQVLVRILDADISPQGPSVHSTITTNIFTNTFTLTVTTNFFTNQIYGFQPTNGIYNFQKAHYRVTRDISQYWGNTPITVFVNRMGTNTAASPTIHYRVNSDYLDNQGGDLENGTFPLQPGSDYATPTPPDSVGILGLVPDFNFDNYSGTISFPAGNNSSKPQPITFSIADNGLQQFNEDFTISLYELDKNNNPLPEGMIDQTTVTIMYDDSHPPAGSVDEYYNADFGYNLLGAVPTVPPQMTHPGTDGEILGLAVQPADDKTIIVGDFFTYDQTKRNSIARVNTDGSLDTTFNPGSGPDNFVNCIALNANGEALIGGAFSSYNGSLCDGIALISSNGLQDTSFNPGQGFTKNGIKGTVYSLAFETNGEVLVGGDFTTYNGTPRLYLALLKPDGSLDTAFNPGTNLNSAVYAICVQTNGQVVVGGNFTSVDGVSGQNYLARLNGDGSFDPSFDPGSGANAAVFALGIQPDGNIVVGGEFTLMNGATANRIARLTTTGFTDPNFFAGTGVDGPVFNVMVATNAIFSTTNSVLPVQTNFTVYVGGAFTSINGTHRLGFARLNADGTVDTTFLDTAYNQFAGLPRDRFNDPLGTVLASGIQSDGNVMIGGSFSRVGGGQSDDVDVRPESIDTNDVLISQGLVSQAQKTRAGIRNRSNLARLIGGATPGPGNIGLLYNNYSINKSQSPINVSLIRNNGTLGPASANFAVAPGLAQSGVDYDYFGVDPFYGTDFELNNPMGRMHSDGLFGTNGFVYDVYGRFYSGSGEASSVAITILDNTNSLNNLTAQFSMTDPIGADQFYLGGEDTPLGVALGESAAPFTIIDDHHQSGTFGFTSANYVGQGTAAPISVSRTGGTYGVVTLNYATTTNGSTAIVNNDYLASSGTLTFQPSDTNQTFSVPILSSNSISAVEKTVNLTLFGLNPPVNGLASLGLTNAVLRLINPNFQGFVNLSSNGYYANLSGGSVTITVFRTVGSKGTVTVQIASTNGTAKSGTDYIGFTNTLQWNSGDVSPKTITVPLINNGNIGVNKQFNVAIYNPQLNSVSTPSLFAPTGTTNAAVFINNDNGYGSFQFSSSGYIVNELGGYSLLTVIRTGGTNGTATVNYTTANATAVSNVNYTVTSGTLTFNPGQLAATIKVPILNDGVVDPAPGQFYFTVALSAPSTGAALGSPTTANNYIVDSSSFNSAPGAPDPAFNPGAGMNADVLSLALQSDGQIIAGGSFTIVDGVPESHLARLNTDGSLDRSGFLYGLSGASDAVYALVAQTDDQILVGGTFTNFNGTVLNRIARLNGLDGSLDSSFNPGAGADNTVYALAEGFVGGNRVIYAGGAFGSMNGVNTPFFTRLTNKGGVDSTFSAGSGPNATVYAVAVYPTNSVFAGKVLIGGAFTNVNNTLVGHIARLNADGSVDPSFNMNVVVGAADTVRSLAIQNDGKVVVGGDFTNFDGVLLNHIARLNSDGTLDSGFTAGIGAGANATVSALALQTDDRIVAAGQFTLANGVTRNRVTRLLPTGAVDPSINFGDGANGAVNAVVIQPGDQDLVIGGSFTTYNDLTANHIARIYGGSVTGSGEFQFTAAGYSVDENGLQAIIGISRVGGTSGPNPDGSGTVSVNFSTITNGSTAVAGVNYSNVSTVVSFPPGEVLRFVTVPVRDDSNATPNLTVSLVLSNATPPATLGDQSTAVLTIINDDSGVSFGSASYSVPKNILTGVGSVHVVRLGSASGSCSVNVFTTTNGTAVTNFDYYATNVLVTFSAGQTDIVVQVPIINNQIPEGNRTVTLGMSNVLNTLQGSPSNTTLTIIDTLTANGQLSFGSTNYTANANDGTATLTVIRTSGSSGNVTVNYNTIPGTATPGVNYQTASGSVTFADGQTNASFTVPLINNNLAIGPVYLNVVLSNPTGGATLIDPTNTTLTIINTNVVIAFTMATNTFAETAGAVPINVVRYNNTTGTSTVKYVTTDNTAFSNVNYQVTSGTLTFNPGDVAKTIVVNLIHDTNYTGTVAFNVNLLSPGPGAQIGAPNPTIVQITDVEAGISFTNSALSVYKNAGSLQVSVVCANTGVEPVIVNSNTVPLSVQYKTVDGTAVAGTDYSSVTGTLVFTNGIGTNIFSVPIINNGFVNGNKQFSVVLFNPTAPGVLVPPSTATVTILDNNTGISFSKAAYTVNKSGGAAAITVIRMDNTNLTSTVNFTATNGTAVNGLNFTATNGTLIFSNGATSALFYVPISDTTVAQPDLTVLLQLSNPVNGALVPPSAATLTIHDDTGSYVIPAGSLLVANSSAPDLANDLIGPGDTVQLQFAFRDAGGTNVNNMVAKILANSNVTAVSPLTNSYGPLAYLGHSTSRPFTFTAAGTNNQPISVNFNLYDVNTNNLIGTAVFGFTLGSVTNSFTNSTTIIINDNTNASPYPSAINVSGVNGSVIKTTVTLNKLYHTSPSDVDALVVSPSGASTLFMAHVGGQNMVTNAVLTFDDASTNYMTHTGAAVTGTNHPSVILPVRNFP